MTKTAVEKFVEAMNQFSDYWVKDIEVTAKGGDIVLIKCDGFTFKGEEKGEI
jgi:hypothetical protein